MGKVAEVLEMIGEVLEKILGSSAEGFRELLEKAFERFWRRFWEVLEKVFGRFWGKIGEVLEKVFGEILEKVSGRLWRRYGEVLDKVLERFWGNDWGDSGEGFGSVLETDWGRSVAAVLWELQDRDMLWCEHPGWIFGSTHGSPSKPRCWRLREHCHDAAPGRAGVLGPCPCLVCPCPRTC